MTKRRTRAAKPNVPRPGRRRRNMDPSNPVNWKVVCSVCGLEWDDAETIDLLGGHFAEEHPELDTPHVHTVWVGVGPQPRRRR